MFDLYSNYFILFYILLHLKDLLCGEKIWFYRFIVFVMLVNVSFYLPEFNVISECSNKMCQLPLFHYLQHVAFHMECSNRSLNKLYIHTKQMTPRTSKKKS